MSAGGGSARPPQPPRAPPAPAPTDIEDPIPRAAPAPALELLLLRVLEAPVMENHPDHALQRGRGDRGAEGQMDGGQRDGHGHGWTQGQGRGWTHGHGPTGHWAGLALGQKWGWTGFELGQN